MALALGMTVREMLSRIDSAELTEWLAYYRLEPFGESVADQRHGISNALLANLHRDPKRSDPAKPTDFIPWHASNRQSDQPVLLEDAEAHSKLMIATIFGR